MHPHHKSSSSSPDYCLLLVILLKSAHSDYLSTCEEKSGLGFEVWCSEMSKERLQFLFWFTIFRLQLDVLMFLRSIREANFELYINSLSNLVPWFFCSLNQYNYARWFPVHLRDMLTLKDDYPLIAKEFSAGKFVVTKTERKFSGLALDHAHEQNNAIVKDDGGAVGLTGNPGALGRWAVAGPKMARLCNGFEDC